MESSILTPLLISFADISVCVALFILVILPRFNSWSETERGLYEGKPRDYIHDRVFREYAGLYFLTFLVIAFVISQVPGLRSFFFNVTAAVIPEKEWTPHLMNLAGQLGQALMAPYLIIFMLLLKLATPVANADERWRTFLLASARVPKDVLHLKQQIRDAVLKLDLSQRCFDDTVVNLSERSSPLFWDRVTRESGQQEGTLLAARLLVKCLYLVRFNQQFDNHYPCVNDLNRIETRLYEIAGVLPAMNAADNILEVQKYLGELETLLERAAEMLARNCVKSYPEASQRNQVLSRHGITLTFTDKKEMDLYLPMAMVFFGTFLLTLLNVAVFLTLFDMMDVSNRQGQWFSMDRVEGWSLGGGFSYVLAVAIGLYMNEALRNRFGHRNLATYIIAFLAASVASMIFFALSRETFKPPYLLLAVNFGLLSLVVIRSRGRGLISQQTLQKKATQIALQYALVSGVLQCLIRVSFYAYRNEDWMSWEQLSGLSLPLFFLFGAVRGGCIAFLVAYVFMDSERAYLQEARRKVPRIRLDHAVHGELAGLPMEVTVVDLSEKGARLRLSNADELQAGDDVALLFSFGRVEGKLMSVKGHHARVCFAADNAAKEEVQHYINAEMGLAA